MRNAAKYVCDFAATLFVISSLTMFKKLVIPSLASAVSSGVLASSSSKSSSSNSCSNGEEELVTKQDIPTLLRRHSFGIPQDTAMFDTPPGDSTEISIDPFDVSTLRRSKSLHFEVSKKPSFGSVKKKPAKSVRFNERSLKPTSFLTGLVNAPGHTNSSNVVTEPVDDEKCAKVQNSLQQFFQIDSNDNSDSHEKIILEPSKDLTTEAELKTEENQADSWFDHVADDNKNLNLNSLRSGIDPKALYLDNSEVNEPLPYTDFSRNNLVLNFEPYKEPEKEKEDSQSFSLESIELEENPGPLDEDFLDKSDEEALELTDSNVLDQMYNDSALNSLLTGLMAHENTRKQQAKEILGDIFQELEVDDVSNVFDQDMLNTLDLILLRIRGVKSNLQEKDLTIAELTQTATAAKENQNTIDTMQSEKLELEQENYEYQQSLNNLNQTNADLEMKVHQFVTERRRLNDRVHELESQTLLKRLRDENEFKALKNLENILADRIDVTDSFDRHLVQVLDDKDELELDLYDFVSKNEELTDLLMSSEMENKQLQIQLEKSATQNADLLSLQNTNKESHQVEINIYLQEINNLTKSLQEKTETHAQHEIQISKLKEEVSGLNLRNNQLIEENTTLKTTLMTTKTETQLVLEELGTLKLGAEWLQKNHQQEISSKDNELVSLSEAMKAKEASVGELKTAVADLKSEISEKVNLATELAMKVHALISQEEVISTENQELIEENRCLVDKNNESEHIIEDIKKQYTQLEASRFHFVNKYNQLVTSNDLLAFQYIDLVSNLRANLKPMMYKESVNYLTQIFKPLQSLKYFDEKNREMFKEINTFIGKAVRDLVFNYLENEKALEKEIHSKESIYDEVFGQVSEAFFGKFRIQEPKVEKHKSKNPKVSNSNKHSPFNSLEVTSSEPKSTTDSEFEISASGTNSLPRIPKYLNKTYKMKKKH